VSRTNRRGRGRVLRRVVACIGRSDRSAEIVAGVYAGGRSKQRPYGRPFVAREEQEKGRWQQWDSTWRLGWRSKGWSGAPGIMLRAHANGAIGGYDDGLDAEAIFSGRACRRLGG
jgi:hypothetical protein